MLRTGALLLTGIALAGCSSSGGGGSAPETLTDAAKAIGCTGYADASADSPLTVEYGTCQLPNGSAQLYRFGTPEVIDTFWTASAAFGASKDQCASAGLVVVCPQAADLAAVKGALA